MKHFYPNLIITSLIASSAAMAADAYAWNNPTKVDLNRYTYKVENQSSPFESDRMKTIMKETV